MPDSSRSFRSVASPRAPGRWWVPSLFTLLIAGILLSYFSGHFLRRNWDGYSYLATIRALEWNGEDPGRYANPAYVIVAAIHHRLDVDPLHLLVALAVVNALVFLSAARLFFRCHFPAVTVRYILFAMLFLWGRVLWSGTYSLVDAYSYFYPQGMAYSLVLFSLYFLHRVADRPVFFVPLLLTQALLLITHIGTSLYYWLVVVIHLAVFRKRLGRRFAIRFGLVTLTGYALAFLWPFYDYTGNVGIFIERLGESLLPAKSAAVPPALAACAAIAFTAGPKPWFRRFLPGALVILPFFGPKGPLLVDIFGFGIMGILGLLLLVREEKYFFPVWWGGGGLLFTLGFIDPTRIILASSFALCAGAGVAMARFFSKPRDLYSWGLVLAALVAGDLFFAMRWESPHWMPPAVVTLAIGAGVIVLVRSARNALPAILLLLVSVPLMIKWNKIDNTPTIDPKPFIEEHVSKGGTVLVVEPNKRGMNKVIGGMQDRTGVFVGSEPESLPFYARKFGTPFVMFYEVEVGRVGAAYDLLARDRNSALIRLRPPPSREEPSHDR